MISHLLVVEMIDVHHNTVYHYNYRIKEIILSALIAHRIGKVKKPDSSYGDFHNILTCSVLKDLYLYITQSKNLSSKEFSTKWDKSGTL